MPDLLSDEKFLENGLTLPEIPIAKGKAEDDNSNEPENNSTQPKLNMDSTCYDKSDDLYKDG